MSVHCFFHAVSIKRPLCIRFIQWMENSWTENRMNSLCQPYTDVDVHVYMYLKCEYGSFSPICNAWIRIERGMGVRFSRPNDRPKYQSDTRSHWIFQWYSKYAIVPNTITTAVTTGSASVVSFNFHAFYNFQMIICMLWTKIWQTT